MECKEALDVWTQDLWTDEVLERNAGQPNTGNCPESTPSKDASSLCVSTA